MASINYYPAHNPTTSYQCSVPAEVMKRPGEYEYCISVFSKYEDTRTTSSKSLNVNLLLESKYPIYISEYTSETGGTTATIFLYEEREYKKSRLLPVRGTFIVNFSEVEDEVETKGSHVMNFKGVTSPWSSGRGGIGIENLQWYRAEGSFTLIPDGSVGRSLLLYNDQDGTNQVTVYYNCAFKMAGMTNYPIRTGQLRKKHDKGDFWETIYDYSVGYLNNPRFSSKEEWQAFCENMFNGGA